MQPFIAEAGHWWTFIDGKPTIIEKTPEGKRIDKRHLRKLELYPGVTYLIRQAEKPRLAKWKEWQAAWAAITLPRLKDEPDEHFVERALASADEIGNKAADRGKAIHAMIEQYFALGISPTDKIYRKIIARIIGWQRLVGYRSGAQELGHINKTMGIGGKVDEYGRIGKTKVILDYKSRNKLKPHDNREVIQHGGYFKLLEDKIGSYKFGDKAITIYIQPETGEINPWDWEEKKPGIVGRAILQFLCLFTFWKLDNNYEPTED